MMRSLLIVMLATVALRAENINALVLEQIRTMPAGGGYATSAAAHDALASSVRVDAAGARILAERATPSYCSGATYIVFLKTLGALQRSGSLKLNRAQWAALAPAKLADGVGVWGRWNANGPGTPRLFYELGLGHNFDSLAEARPGDFAKLFWTTEVGRDERGHSVIFLGLETNDGVENVRFWSSNKPGGYGEKSVPRKKIAQAIFSRLESPNELSRLDILPHRDPYLASLLSRRSSFAEARRMSGIP